MSLINVQNLTFAYDGGFKNVFENVSFSIDTDWKLGFVGRNGRGKTTFLKLLAGKYGYAGKITANVEFTLFPFDLKNEDATVMEVMGEICPFAREWEINREFSLLDLRAELPYLPYGTLSGGEKTKVMLAGLFLKDGNFLLIDEPTNHLDSEARKAVARYLRGKKGFILVSHDRDFLDGCVDHILSVNKDGIEIQSGNFSSWYENFGRRLAFENTRNERLKKDIARLSETAKRTAVWADKTESSKYGKASSGLKQDKGYVGHKAAKIMKRAKTAEARVQNEIEQKSQLLRNAETAEDLKLDPLIFRSERLLSCNDLEIVYGGKKICPPVSFELSRGERIAVEGKNGSGKSSIVKLIAGEDIPHTGVLSLPSGLIVSYVPQTYGALGGKVADFAKEKRIDGALLRAVLDKMGLTESDCDGDISGYSEGQKKKLLIAASLCTPAHLYVWDEPLNYLDIYARMQIERLITRFKPTMIFVEHDEAFRRAAATKTIRL